MENLKIEEKFFNEIKNKFKEKGYDNVLDYYRGYVANNVKISVDFLSIDRNTKIPLLAFELKRIQNIEELQQPKQNMLKEIIVSIERIKNVYKNINYLDFYLIIFDTYNKNKIFKVNFRGKYEEINRIDDILDKPDKTISTYISSKKESDDKIKKYSRIFIGIFIILFFLFVLNLFYFNLNYSCIKYLIIILLIIYGLCIIPYVKEVNFWGLQIKNFDLGNKR